MSDAAEELKAIDNFDDLLPFLETHMGWPFDLAKHDKDNLLEEVTFEYTPEEIGIDPESVPNVRNIWRLRRLHDNQPFGIFLVKFDDKKIKITTMRRILRAFTKRQKESANSPEFKRWDEEDIMFITNFGESGERKLSFAYFQESENTSLPTLRVIGWDGDDTPARLNIQANELTEKLHYPKDENNAEAWREKWCGAFNYPQGHVIATTGKLSDELAKLATKTRRAIEDILEVESEHGPLNKIKDAFQKSIFPNLTEADFADMYAQTVAYGLLSTRIERDGKKDMERYQSSKITPDDVTNFMDESNPFLKELFEFFVAVGDDDNSLDFDELDLSETREMLAKTEMHEILADFGRKKQDPKIFLYEYFLKKYDKIRRKNLGVFYTPKQAVRFIIRSVHEELQNKFGLADGLADISTWNDVAKNYPDITIPKGCEDKPFVQILDPAAGTGTFLIETINFIHEYMQKKWGKQGSDSVSLWNDYVDNHLLPRLHGFELMMAPYAMTHLSISMKLKETGYTNSYERAKIYLTNTLAEPFNSGKQLEMEAVLESILADEGQGANKIKTETPITVIIGNPPYAVDSMTPSKDNKKKLTWIGELIQPYFGLDGTRLNERNSKMLNDDYVKFIRYAEYHIEETGVGVLGYITNNAYLGNTTFRGMRYHLLNIFSSITIADLHGDSRNNEKTPDGSKDENVFDIMQGVAVAIMTRQPDPSPCHVNLSDLYGLRHSKDGKKGKLDILEKNTITELPSISLNPKELFYLFAEQDDSFESEFYNHASITEIMKTNSVGILTGRDKKLCIQKTFEKMQEVVEDFASLETEEARKKYDLGDDTRDWKVHLAQQDLQRTQLSSNCIKAIDYRPFDPRYTYYTDKYRGFLSLPRSDVMYHVLKDDNLALITVRQMSAKNHCWQHSFVANKLMDGHFIGGGINYAFPLKLKPTGTDETTRENLSKEFLDSITASTGLDFQPLYISNKAELFERGDLKTTFGCRDAFDYIYAILQSPKYRTRYKEFLIYDFPRIPPPKNRDLFTELAKLGGELIRLHLLDDEHPLLKQPKIRINGQGNNQLGKFNKNECYNNGRVHINKTRWFEDITPDAWNFEIGAFAPLQKWLSDRSEKGGKKNPRPGHILTEEDILHYRRMAVAITETMKIMEKIDTTIHSHGAFPSAFTPSL